MGERSSRCRQRFEGNCRFRRKKEIVASEENRRVETELDFGGQGTANAAFDLTPEDDGTKVTWSFEADLGMNPIGRYCGLTIGERVGADYGKGLAALKTLFESKD